MKLIIGLGNPGPEYAHTRHNVGFMFVDYLAEKLGAAAFTHKKKFDAEIADVEIAGEKVILAKPQTYMNDSGRAVSALANFYNLTPSDLIIVHDDLDIQLGAFKIQTAKGPKVHNGLLSIEKSLGSTEFMRVRIGVASQEKRSESYSGKNFVLSSFSQVEQEHINNTFPVALQKLQEMLS